MKLSKFELQVLIRAHLERSLNCTDIVAAVHEAQMVKYARAIVAMRKIKK